MSNELMDAILNEIRKQDNEYENYKKYVYNCMELLYSLLDNKRKINVAKNKRVRLIVNEILMKLEK